MLTLPPKPWRTMLVETQGPGVYLMTFLLPDRSKEVFDEIMRDYVLICLRRQDRLVDADWETNSAVIELADLDTFMMDMAIRGFSVSRG